VMRGEPERLAGALTLGYFYQPEADAVRLSIPGERSINHTPRGNWFLGAQDVAELARETPSALAIWDPRSSA
jgi:hypothetical protein